MSFSDSAPGDPADAPHDSDHTIRWTERVLGWSLVGGTIAVVLLSRGAEVAERLALWPWAGCWYGLLVLPPLIFIVGAAARRPVPRLGAALDVGLFLWAFAAIAGAWFAASRPTAMSAAVLPFATICLAYVVRGWLGFDPVISRRRARHVLSVVSVAMAVVLATAWWVPGPISPGRESAAVGLAVMAIPLFAGFAATAAGSWRYAWFFAVALAVVFVAIDGGLAGTSAVGAMVVCGGLALVATQRMPRGGWAGVVMGVAVVAGLCIGAWTPERAADDATVLAARERTALIRMGVAMGADRPWLGHGPGMVAWVHPNYAARFSVMADEVRALPSTPVQVWAEHGVLGLLVMLSLGLGVGLRAWRLRPGGVAAGAGTHEDRLRAWSVVCALGAGAGFALAEYPLDAPPLLAVLAALLPVLSALTRPVSDARVAWSPTFVRVTPAAAVAVGIALIGWHVGPDLRARRDFAAALSAAGRGDTEEFIATVRRARALAPWDARYPDTLARYFAGEADQAGDAPRARSLRGLAIGLFRQSITARPGQLAVRLKLGAVLLAANEPEAAAQEFRAATGIAPNNGEVYHQLGMALLRTGETTAAIDAFALEWIVNPTAATAAVWMNGEEAKLRGDVAAKAAARLAILARDARSDVAEIAEHLSWRWSQGNVPSGPDDASLPPAGWLPAGEWQRLIK